MYLISAYFDLKTEKKLQSYIDAVASITGNTFMLDNNIPPHITLAAFEARDEENVLKVFEQNIDRIVEDKIYFATIGALNRQVVYIQPVLNAYLHDLSNSVHNMYSNVTNVKFSPLYMPFSWLPHVSTAKHLCEGDIVRAFEYLVKNFVPFEGVIDRIGLAKTNPHRDVYVRFL